MSAAGLIGSHTSTAPSHQSLLWRVCGRLVRCPVTLFATLRRLLCFWRRRSSVSAPLLGHNSNSAYPTSGKAPIRTASTKDDEWDDWDHPVEVHTHASSATSPAKAAQNPDSETVNPADLAEPDYFQDMAPVVKRAKKLIINDASQGLSDKFKVQEALPAFSATLGDLDEVHTDEQATWNDDDDDVYDKLKAEHRRQENARRKQEKIAQRDNRIARPVAKLAHKI